MRSLSGKFVLRVDPTLHLRLKQEAEARKTSLNQWVVAHLEGLSPMNPTYDVDSRLIAAVAAAFGADLLGVILFGSTVRGERRENSDIDLLIVLKKHRPIDRTLYRVWDKQVATVIGDEYSPQFSHVPSLEAVSSLWLEMAIEGEILFDGEGSLKELLRLIRGQIAKGIYCRKTSHGHPYWVHLKE
jgi:predicted nucleotidyltransferase